MVAQQRMLVIEGEPSEPRYAAEALSELVRPLSQHRVIGIEHQHP
jgi:hypothetical protein